MKGFMYIEDEMLDKPPPYSKRANGKKDSKKDSIVPTIMVSGIESEKEPREEKKSGNYNNNLTVTSMSGEYNNQLTITSLGVVSILEGRLLCTTSF